MFQRLLSRRARLTGRVVAASSTICIALGSAAISPAAANASCTSPSAGASGDVCSFSVSPETSAGVPETTAGSAPYITSSIAFTYGSSTTDSVKSLSVTLPPGLFASLGSLTEICTSAQLSTVPPTCPPGSQVGTGSLTSTLLPKFALTAALYLTPAPSPADAAGIGTVISYDGIPLLTTSGSVTESQVDGNAALSLNLPSLPDSLFGVPIQLSTLNFTINGQAPTVTGTPSSTPFTRLPTNCSTATSTLTIQTYAASSADGTGSSSFTPTACSSLAFSPTLTATATKDPNDTGVSLITTVTTNPSQAAEKSLVLSFPNKTLPQDVFNAGKLFGQTVGSATAVTPLVPTPLVGTVTLTGTISAPVLTITFPPPFALSFSGAINVVNNSVTFAGVPDVPLNSLKLDLTGGSAALFYTTCAQPTGAIDATFGGQNGATAATTAELTVNGCPKPALATVSGGTASGFASGSAKLGFALAAGSGKSKLASFTIALPSGLSFKRSGYSRGVSVSGGKIKSEKLSHGRLAVTLKSPVASLKVKITGAALTESGSLQKQISARKLTSLSAKIYAKNTSGSSTTLTLKLRV